MMKKILILFLVALPFFGFTQQLIKRETAFTPLKFLELSSGKYIRGSDFTRKYGKDALSKLVNDAFGKNEIDSKLKTLIETTYELTPWENIQSDRESVVLTKKHQGPVRMRPVNLSVGISVIGVSAAGYMIVNSAMNDKIRKHNQRITEISGEIAGLSFSPNPDKTRIEELTTEMKGEQDKSEKADKGRTTAGYICGAASLAGVIVILTGLHRDNAGIPVAKNTFIDSRGANLSLAWKF